ncbi:hypothetical protein [Curtobacterium pusillum]|uniref:hypothetical protein n=1 Tax=Curtobacterium pusillum TaxID=69373 RepID=UPI0011A061C5|nr:hypothetical protein [Curtobacterium pusillum]
MSTEERAEPVQFDEVPPCDADDGPDHGVDAESVLPALLCPEHVGRIAAIEHRRIDVLLTPVELDDDTERRDPEVDSIDGTVWVAELDLRFAGREVELDEPDRGERLTDGLVSSIERCENGLSTDGPPRRTGRQGLAELGWAEGALTNGGIDGGRCDVGCAGPDHVDSGVECARDRNTLEGASIVARDAVDRVANASRTVLDGGDRRIGDVYEVGCVADEWPAVDERCADVGEDRPWTQSRGNRASPGEVSADRVESIPVAGSDVHACDEPDECPRRVSTLEHPGVRRISSCRPMQRWSLDVSVHGARLTVDAPVRGVRPRSVDGGAVDWHLWTANFAGWATDHGRQRA